MNFKVTYLVYPVRQLCRVTLTLCFPLKIDTDAQYTISFTPFSGLRIYGLRNTAIAPTADDIAFFGEKHSLIIAEDLLSIDVTLPQEDRKPEKPFTKVPRRGRTFL